MEKNKQLNKLTWEYFIEAKIKEIVLTLLIIAAIVFIPYLLGHFIGDNESVWCSDSNDWDIEEECNPFFNWAEGLIYSVISFMVIFYLFMWLSSNWKKAEKKAKKELKIKGAKD